MTTITTPGSDEAVALLLEGAARELQFNGLASGRMKRPVGSVCLYGALAQAAGIDLATDYDATTNRMPDGWFDAFFGSGATHVRAVSELRAAGYTQMWSDTAARANELDPVEHIHALKIAAEAVRAGESIPTASQPFGCVL